jgi:hypothetical protein
MDEAKLNQKDLLFMKVFWNPAKSNRFSTGITR